MPRAGPSCELHAVASAASQPLAPYLPLTPARLCVSSTREMIKNHNSRSDVWMSIHGKVIDVTKYLDDHPGGEEVLLDRAGQDGTEDFEDVGHSNEARKQLASMEVGELPPSERTAGKAESGGSGGGMGAMVIVPVLVAVAGAAYYYMFML